MNGSEQPAPLGDGPDNPAAVDATGGATVPVDDVGAARLYRRPLIVVALLAAMAGFVDAYAFLTLGVFVANMTGNIVFLGLGLGGAHAEGWLSALALVGFVAGASMGLVLRSLGARRDLRAASVVPLAVQCVVMAIVIAGLAVSPLASGTHSAWAGAVVLLLSLVNGLQAFVITKVHGVTTPTTYATGTVVSTSASLVGTALDRGRDEGDVWRRRLGIAITTPAAYLVGAYSYSLLRDFPAALLLPLLVMLGILAVSLRPLRPVEPSSSG